MVKHCKGCVGYYEHDHCVVEEFNKNGSCPCTNCVVKVMCDSICDAFINFRDYVKPEYKSLKERMTE